MPINYQSSVTVGQVKTVKVFTFPMSGSGTQTIFTASGNVAIINLMFYMLTSAAGLVSMTIQNNEATPKILLASILLASLTGGNNLTPYTAPFVLADTKTVSAVYVGTASAGQLLVVAEYYKATGGDLV